MNKMWTKDEEDTLRLIFENKKNEEISSILGKSKSSIINKANQLRLRKSKSHISNIMVNRNKNMGRDLTYRIS
jgi:hypothetical protein